MEPVADGFRNYAKPGFTERAGHYLVDRAQLLTLTVPEMTVLVGGMRALGANWDGSADGILVEKPGQLTNDFFKSLLDCNTVWTRNCAAGTRFEGVNRETGQRVGTATNVDLIFGSNSELRAIAEVYASDDASHKFVRDFVNAWTKVMNLDRFDQQ